jgi:hypothetical protein
MIHSYLGWYKGWPRLVQKKKRLGTVLYIKTLNIENELRHEVFIGTFMTDGSDYCMCSVWLRLGEVAYTGREWISLCCCRCDDKVTRLTSTFSYSLYEHLVHAVCTVYAPSQLPTANTGIHQHDMENFCIFFSELECVATPLLMLPFL